MSVEATPEDLARTATNAAHMAAAAAEHARTAADQATAYAEQVFDDRPMTTAEVLGQYRRDLRDEGFEWPIIDDLARDLACRHLHEHGITVGRKPEDPAAAAIKKAQQRLAEAVEREHRHRREVAAARYELTNLRQEGQAVNAVNTCNG